MNEFVTLAPMFYQAEKNERSALLYMHPVDPSAIYECRWVGTAYLVPPLPRSILCFNFWLFDFLTFCYSAVLGVDRSQAFSQGGIGIGVSTRLVIFDPSGSVRDVFF